MAASVVPLAWTMEFQKVMLTVPLWLASALRLQLGRLAAPAGGRRLPRRRRPWRHRWPWRRRGPPRRDGRGVRSACPMPTTRRPGAGGHPAYFTAPAVRLRTSCFWKTRSRMTRGTKAMTAPASDTGICDTWVPEQLLEPDLHRVERRRPAGRDQRPQVLVPGPEEGEDAQGGQRGAGQRHGHPGHEAQVPVAVELGRLLEVARDLQEGLAQQEDAEARGQEGHGQALVGVEPVQRADGVEVGDERHLERDHQRGQAEDEEGALEGEAQEGEGVGGQDRGDELPDHDDHRHDGRGRHVLGHLPRRPGRGVVAPLRVGREERRRLLDQLVGDEQRVDHRHVDREEHDDGPRREQRVAADGAPAPRRALRRPGPFAQRA